jgi:hypothetical protein
LLGWNLSRVILILFSILRGDIDLVGRAHSFPKILDTLPQALKHLGNATGTKHHEDDDKND